MIEPLSILTIIAFWLLVKTMTGMLIFTVICMLGFGIAVIFAEEIE